MSLFYCIIKLGDSMSLSKSRYCDGIQCKKKLWLETYKPEVREEVDNESVFENGNKVGELARDLFKNHKDVSFNNNLNEMIKETNEYLKEKNVVICEASFNYNNNFCSVDILKKDNDEYEIYEVKSSTEVSDVYLDDISYQYYVLSNLGLNVKKCFIVYLNNKYYRKGELELNKLFNKEDVTLIAKDKFNEIDGNIKELNKCLSNKNEPNIDLGVYCSKPYDCEFFKYCSKHLPEQNIFNIRGLNFKKKIELYNKGIYKYEDVLKEKLKDDYREQVEFELYNLKDKIFKIINVSTLFFRF